MDKQDNGRKTRGRFGTGWMVALASVAVLGLTFAAQAYPPPGGDEEGRAERERTGFDTDEIRNRLGIPDFGQPLPAERLDGIVDSANELRDRKPDPPRTAVSSRDSTGAGITGGDPRVWERNQCIAAGGNWDAARNYCSFAEQTCREMGWRWVGNECQPPDQPPGGGSLVSTGVFEGCNMTGGCPGHLFGRVPMALVEATNFTNGATCRPTVTAFVGTPHARVFPGTCASSSGQLDVITNVSRTHPPHLGQDRARLTNLCPWGGNPVQTSNPMPSSYWDGEKNVTIHWYHTWQCFN